MDESEKELRNWCLNHAADVWKIKNSQMVLRSDAGIVVFDGNKSGTHNVVQQLVEHNKSFVWINPAGKKVWECFWFMDSFSVDRLLTRWYGHPTGFIRKGNLYEHRHSKC